MQVFLEALVVEGLECLGIVKVFVVWVGDSGVLAEDLGVELIWPPVFVSGTATANVGLLDVFPDWARSHDCDVC